MKKTGVFLGFQLLTLGAGFIGSLATQNGIQEWYPTLTKPWFTPPNEWFAPVWIALYILIGISGALIFLSKDNEFEWRKMGLTVFFIQLILNALWSILFFGLQEPGFALFDIVLLLTSIVITIRYFFPINKAAAYLMLPYVLWVSFATALNAGIWVLN